MFTIDFFCFLLSEVYKSGNNRKLMASSSSDKIFIRCGESCKQNTSLNHVGARYRDNQNEQHHL